MQPARRPWHWLSWVQALPMSPVGAGGAQSESVEKEHPAGQQPSPPRHEVIGEETHCAVHWGALPVSASLVQAS